VVFALYDAIDDTNPHKNIFCRWQVAFKKSRSNMALPETDRVNIP
jgi:hypothetical protein